jgi:hypothetical protein
MIVKCSKTGKILASEDEIKEHAEAFGVSAFEEIKPDETFIWINNNSGKYCFSRNELDVFCKRTGEDPAGFSEISVTEFLKYRDSKKEVFRNDARVEKFSNDRFLSMLVDVRGYSTLQAEKALWCTRNESVQAAETWLREHAKDPDFNLPLKLSYDAVVPESMTPSFSEPVKLVDFIDTSMLQELTSMGFTKERSSRALWKTNNGGTSAAVEWLTAHAEDTDIDDPLPEEISVAKKGPKLSKEEAQQAALDLQRRLREERLARDTAEAKELEKQRLASTKAMLEQQEVMEEQRRKRDLADRERLKREEEAHKAELAEKLRLDFIERFGYEPPSADKSAPAGKPKDRILQLLNQIKRQFNAEAVKACLSTLKLYLQNIESNSAEKKYHKIKKANRIFLEKVAHVPPAIELLGVCGFEDDQASEFLEIKTSVADGYLCAQAVKYIDVILNQL